MYICTFIHLYVCVIMTRSSGSFRACPVVCVCVRESSCVCVHACVRVSVSECVFLYVCVFVHACVRVRVCVCERGRIRICEGAGKGGGFIISRR